MSKNSITKFEKQKAIAAMLIDTKTKQISEVEEEYFLASHAAYKAFYGKDVQKMKKLPSGWLEQLSSKGARIQGEYCMLEFEASQKLSWWRDNFQLCFEPKIRQGKFDKFLPFPYEKAITSNNNDDHFEAFEKLMATYKAKDDLRCEINKLFDDCMQSISPNRTYSSVIKAWPEIEKYLIMPDSNPLKKNLPAINFSSLNERLGIPKDE